MAHLAKPTHTNPNIDVDPVRLPSGLNQQATKMTTSLSRLFANVNLSHIDPDIPSVQLLQELAHEVLKHDFYLTHFSDAELSPQVISIEIPSPDRLLPGDDFPAQVGAAALDIVKGWQDLQSEEGLLPFCRALAGLGSCSGCSVHHPLGSS